MSKPIRPEEVVGEKRKSIPPIVIDVFNDYIAERWSGFSSSFKQKEVLAEVLKRMNAVRHDVQFTDDEVFKKHWLDVEDIYREAGWDVKYDKPGYNEDYDASFEFCKPKAHR
jgi:hypothetical protein